MTRTLAETLLFTSLAINAALLIFLAGVLRMVMNDMNESEFKQFVVSLVHHSKKSPFMLTVLNIPFLGAIPYFYFYRFANRWLLAGPECRKYGSGDSEFASTCSCARP